MSTGRAMNANALRHFCEYLAENRKILIGAISSHNRVMAMSVR
jgi:hypothetical protein